MNIKERLIQKINSLSEKQLWELLVIIDEKRRRPRKAFIMEVHYEVGSESHTDFILDISEGGLFMETINNFSVGEEILFSFELRDSKDPILVDGNISWQGKHGFGVQFAELDDHQRQMITQLINSTNQP